MKMVLGACVAVVAMGWIGAEGYYMVTGHCPLSGGQEAAIAPASPTAMDGAVAPKNGSCCPMEGAVAPASPTAMDGAVAPKTSAPTDGAVAPKTSAPTDGAVAPKASAPTDGAVAPKTDSCCPTEGAVAPAGSATPAQVKADGKGDCGGCCPPEDCPPAAKQ